MITLLYFGFAFCKGIGSRPTQTNIISITAGDTVITSTAKDAVVPAQAVYRVCTGTAQDEIVALGTGQDAGAGDEGRHADPCTDRWFQVIDIERDDLGTDTRGRNGVGGGDSRHGGNDDKCSQPKE